MSTAIICPNCLKETTESAHFCAGCGAPLTSHATTDPLGQVYSMGHAFGRATSRRPRRIVLIGVWMIFGPTALINLMQIGMVCSAWLRSFSSSNVRMGGGPIATTLAILFWAGILAIQVAILWKVTRNSIRGSRPLETHAEPHD